MGRASHDTHGAGARARAFAWTRFVPGEILAFLAAPEHRRRHHALPEHGTADTTVIQWQTMDDLGGDRGETNCVRKPA